MKEPIMAKVTLNATASAIMNRINPTTLKAINARKLKEARDPDAELTELEQLNKSCTECLNELDKQCNTELKDVTDMSTIRITKARYKLLKEECKGEFEKLMEPLRLTPEGAGVISEVIMTTGGHKVGGFLSAPIKGAVGFLNGFTEASGLNKLNPFTRR